MRIYRLPELRRYSQNFNSIAFLFDTTVVLCLIFIPWAIAYVTEGFYIKTIQNPEPVDVRYDGGVLGFLKTDKNVIVYRNIDPLDSVRLSSKRNERSPTISYSHMRRGKSNYKKRLKIKLLFPIKLSEKVFEINLLLPLVISLKHVDQSAQKVVISLSKSALDPFRKLIYVGDLLCPRDFPLESNLNVQNIKFKKEFGGKRVSRYLKYLYENVTFSERACMKDRMITLNYNTNSLNYMEIVLSINYSMVRLKTKSRFWLLIKFGWIQYLSIALIFYYLGEKFRAVIYYSQSVRTYVTSTFKYKT